MLLEILITLVAAVPQDCPIVATEALSEITGTWRVLMIGGLDRTHPDSAIARATIESELQGCLLRERLLTQGGNPPYEGLILWGVNGADSTVQRVFAHSQHGRLGVYQGRRLGAEILLRQQSLPGQSDAVAVENRVLIRDHDHFVISSRLSNDGGRTWQLLSRWEYRRASP